MKLLNKQSKRDKMRRLVSLILVIGLLLSIFATVIFYLVTPAFASEDDTPAISDTISELSEIPQNKLLRIGLMYGSNVTVGFETDAKYGFVINKVNRTGDLTNEPLWETDITKVSCTVDANLSKTAMTYSKTSNPASTVIGGYHFEIASELSFADTKIIIDILNSSLSTIGMYAFPAYINDVMRIRVGHFPSKEAAELAAVNIVAAIGDIPYSIAAPSNTGVSLVDPITNIILFEYDCGDVTALGLTPKSSPEGERAYLITPAKKIYDGTFMFRRYISGATDGVSLTDIIGIEEYIKGVLPYEISSSWHYEAQKAFAIVVRSFTLSSVRHEKTYQVDLCNSTHCQVYGGRTKITESVERAVDETAGLVLAHDNKIVAAYYSAVTGGVTVSSFDAWGFQNIPYLVAIQTPWEIYTNHSYGAWTVEVSPTELCTYLQSKGYTSLKGSIKAITIEKLAENSTYVRDISFTDIYGNKVTVKASENVRSALAKYVKSANFVVGKGQVETENMKFLTVSPDSISALTSSATHSLGGTQNAAVLTASGPKTTAVDKGYVLSASGKYQIGATTATSEKSTVYAKNSENFIFVGKGWGHGVGVSQIGLRDLANLGYSWDEMVLKYFPMARLADWRTVGK